MDAHAEKLSIEPALLWRYAEDLEFWSTRWRCPKMEIYIAVREVGPMPKDVEQRLREKGVIPG